MMARVIATVEADATVRLQKSGGGSGGASSSSSSTRSALQQPCPPPPPQLPMPFVPQEPQPQPPQLPQPNIVPPPPAPPPTLDVSMSLQSNARRLVQARLGRPMTQPEIQALDAGLVEALGVLRVGTNEEHRAALQSVALTQLSTPAGAQLWACLLEAAGRGVQGVEEYATAVTGAASTIASAQFASSLGL